jgi:hypothetical protein
MDRQSGAVAVEYAILVGLIAVVIVGAVGALGMAVLPDEQVARIVSVLGGGDPETVPEPGPALPVLTGDEEQDADCVKWHGGGNSTPPKGQADKYC